MKLKPAVWCCVAGGMGSVLGFYGLHLLAPYKGEDVSTFRSLLLLGCFALRIGGLILFFAAFMCWLMTGIGARWATAHRRRESSR
jgi:hypothetical protein